jgi:hypothetical protein
VHPLVALLLLLLLLLLKLLAALQGHVVLPHPPRVAANLVRAAWPPPSLLLQLPRVCLPHLES